LFRRVVSGIILTILVVSMLTSAFNIMQVKASGTIYIRADGSVYPSTAPIQRDGDIYTFTDNINASLVVERDNIVVDGAGYVLKGGGSGIGIDLSGRSNVTVKSVKIMAFQYGIYLALSFNNKLLGNNITENKDYAIWSTDANESSNNTIVGNSITNNGGGIITSFWASYNNISNNSIIANNESGIDLRWRSSHNTLCGNNITGNGFGIWVGESSSNNTLGNNSLSNNKYNFGVTTSVKIEFFMNDIDVSNTVDGKTIYYWINKSDMTVPLDAGYVALINCTNITAKSLNLTNNGEGLLAAFTQNATITQNNIANNQDGILFSGTSNINISYNNITNNMDAIEGGGQNASISHNNIRNGIMYLHLSGSNVSYNNITDGTIELSTSSNNNISHNNIVSDLGIKLSYSSSYNIIAYNNITNGFEGLSLIYSSNYNNISNNNIANNRYGIALHFDSSNNRFFHNNFINNTYPVDLFNAGTNIWDKGYPYGGNYWSTYAGVDLLSGPFPQSQTGSDGIGDTPYILGSGNGDLYPLMNPWTKPTIQDTTVTKAGKPYTIQIASNVTIADLKASGGSIKLTVKDETAANGYIRIIQPISLNSTSIKVFSNTIRIDFPSSDPPRSISNNSTHYFIYLEFTLSTHNITVLLTKMGDIGGGLTPQFFNFDGKVDGKDLALFLQCFKGTAPPEAMYLADLGGGVPPQFFKYDGAVDGKDLALFLMCYKSLGPDP